MKIRRIRNNKEEIFERKEREKIYNVKKTMRFNDKEYELFVQKCKENGVVPTKVIRELMKKYVKRSK